MLHMLVTTVVFVVPLAMSSAEHSRRHQSSSGSMSKRWENSDVFGLKNCGTP
jgi:hypothetical protein